MQFNFFIFKQQWHRVRNISRSTPSLTSVSWSSALAIGARKTRPASGALLPRGSRGTGPTWLTRRSWYCSDWCRGLNRDLVQYGVVARQVACHRRGRVVKTEEVFQSQEKHRKAPEQVCGYNSLLTLDKLFTHLPCDGAHGSLGLHITLKKWGFKSLQLDNQTVDL